MCIKSESVSLICNFNLLPIQVNSQAFCRVKISIMLKVIWKGLQHFEEGKKIRSTFGSTLQLIQYIKGGRERT